MNINHSKESLILLIEQLNIKLAEKEEENRHLRARAYDWKKKYLENESIYQSLIKQYEEREKQILTDHENQMNALTTAHVEKMNDMSTLILKLQEQLNHQSHIYDHHSLTSSPYSDNDNSNIVHNIEDIHTLADPMTIHHRDKATDLILNMNDLMVDIETRINDYIAVNHLNEEDSSDEFETSASSEEEGEESDHVYDIEEENINYPVKLRPSSLSSATSSILPSLPLQQQVLENEKEKGKDIAIDKHRHPYHPSNNNNHDSSSNNNNHSNPSSNNNHNTNNNYNINNMNSNINNNINDDNDDVHSYTSSIHRYPSTNELYKKKNRSSFSLFSSQHHHQQQQQQQQQSNPILHSKPTLENLSKVIPNFLLKKQTKSEQWKISHRHSFIEKRT